MSISSQVQEYPLDAIISFQRSSLVLFLVSLGVFLLPRVFSLCVGVPACEYVHWFEVVSAWVEHQQGLSIS